MGRAESSQMPWESAFWLVIGRQERGGVQTVVPSSSCQRGVSGRKRATQSMAGLQGTAREKSQPGSGCSEQRNRRVSASLGHPTIRASQQQLARVGPFLTRVEARAVLGCVVDLLQDERQRAWPRPAHRPA
jgi:hypothetical protein